LIKVRVSPYPRVRRIKAVTIGLGFQCADGVVLCSDRQISKTGGLKFTEQKISHAIVRGAVDADIAMTYGGDRDIAKNLFREITQSLPLELNKRKETFPQDRIIGFLRDAVPRKDSKYVEMLVAFSSPQFPPTLFVIRGSQVLQGIREYIGVGDSSVIRYISELISRPLSANQAVTAGIYMVSLANRFVEGCSDGPDALYMRSYGKFALIEKGRYDPWLKEIDGDLGEVLRKNFSVAT
jgi:hypothetical protein